MPLSLCTIDGVLYDVNGNVKAGVAIYVAKVVKSGATIQLKEKKVAVSDAAGLVSFTVPGLSTTWIRGNFYVGSTSFNHNTGISCAIPDAATATLESLGAASSVPVQGVTVKSNGSGLANLIGTLDFSTAFSVTESPTGEANIDLSASLIVTTEQVQDALATFFPDVAPYDWTYDDANNKVGLVIAPFVGDSGAGGVTGLVPAPALGDGAANKFLKADGLWTAVVAPAWGAITGTLASQTDLQAALDAKANSASLATVATSGSAADLTGALADARLSANVTLGGNTFAGTGSMVRATSPTLVTPVLGVASASKVSIVPPSAAGVALRIDPAGSQTGNLIEVTSDGSAIRFRLDAAGRIGSRGALFGAGAESGTITYDLFTFMGTLAINGNGVAGIGVRSAANAIYGWNATNDNPNGTATDTNFGKLAAGVIGAGTGSTTPNALAAVLGGRAVVAKTTNYPIVAATDNSKLFTNAGASGTVVFTLPTAVPGLQFTFYVDAAFTLQVTAGASTTIRIAGSVSAAAGNITNATVGGCVTLVAISATQWVAQSHEGTWVIT